MNNNGNGWEITAENSETCVTNYISKVVTTGGCTTDATFKGNEVIDYAIAPQGVAKASINTITGVISFEKYDPNWCGEVTLSLATQDKGDASEQYVHDFSINFEGVDGGEDDIDMLTDEEEEETEGGAASVWIPKSKRYIATKKGHYIQTIYKNSKTGAVRRTKGKMCMHQFTRINGNKKRCRVCGYQAII